MNYRILAAFALFGTSSAFAATMQIQPDQRGWLSPSTTTNQVNSITVGWGSTELVVNGGFETDNWAGTGANATSTTYAHSGLQSLQGTGLGNVQQDVVVSGDVGAIYHVSVWTGKTTDTTSRVLTTHLYTDDSVPTSELVSVLNVTNDITSGFVERTYNTAALPSNIVKIRVNLNKQAAAGSAYWDDVSVKPVNLYVYRSSSPFTNTGSATLIDTLDGLTATGYTDSSITGDYWYAVSATNQAVDVTSFMGTAVPEPAGLGLVLGATILFIRRRNDRSATLPA